MVSFKVVEFLWQKLLNCIRSEGNNCLLYWLNRVKDMRIINCWLPCPCPFVITCERKAGTINYFIDLNYTEIILTLACQIFWVHNHDNSNISVIVRYDSCSPVVGIVKRHYLRIFRGNAYKPHSSHREMLEIAKI